VRREPFVWGPEIISALLGAAEALGRRAVARTNYGPLFRVLVTTGLRVSEALALRWQDVDLATGRLAVERSWDMRVGVIEPKSEAGRRRVPLAAILRDFLDQHKVATGRTDGLVFGRTETRPFEPVSLAARAATAWKAENVKREEKGLDPLEPITLHEARHTYASLMIAAGVNAKALSTYMGHASITITYDRYGHLMPGNEEEAADRLDAYLARADTAARVAQVEA
jgi:integrase